MFAEPARNATTGGPIMLENARVATRLPTQDLERARRWYSEKLGLEPARGAARRAAVPLLQRRVRALRLGRRLARHVTQMGFEVDDLESIVTELKRRGVEFEEVDIPGLETTDGMAEVEGNYPSKGGKGERAAWFRDCEGNMLGLGQPIT